MGNSNPELHRDDNLAGVRGWFHFVAGCTRAHSTLPTRTPSHYGIIFLSPHREFLSRQVYPQSHIPEEYRSPLFQEEVFKEDLSEGHE